MIRGGGTEGVVRHGPASLHAALNVHSGEVLATPIPGKNDSENFCAFLEEIDVDPTSRSTS